MPEFLIWCHVLGWIIKPALPRLTIAFDLEDFRFHAPVC
jgi:hypothetical protein